MEVISYTVATIEKAMFEKDDSTVRDSENQDEESTIFDVDAENEVIVIIKGLPTRTVHAN